MPPFFFLYARKSTDTEEKQVLSIEAQLVELRLFAEKESLTIKQEFIEAMTAKVPGRPIFNEMISRIEKGEAQGIIAWHPDRLARNSVDGGRIIYLLDTEKIQFLKFPTFWFENTPQGKFMMQIAFGQSKYFIDNLTENVRRGQRQKLRRGEWPFINPPGYLPGGRNSFPKIDPVKGPIIKKIYEAYLSGDYTLEDLTKISFQWGLTSRTGKPFAISMIQRCLTNPFYYGLLTVKGESYQGVHEPIVSKELFDQVQQMIVRKGKPNKYKKHKFPLLGLVTCAHCGCSITAERQKGHHYYRCTKKRGVCPEPYIREEKLAEQFRQIISKVALPSDIYQKMLAEWAKERDETSQPVVQFKIEQNKKISEIQEKLDRLLDFHLNRLITQSEYQSKKETLLNEKIGLEENLKKMEQGATGWLEPCREFLEAAHHLAAAGNLESLREKAKKVGSNFRLAAKTLSFSYRLPWRLLAAAADFSIWRSQPDSNRCLCRERAPS